MTAGHGPACVALLACQPRGSDQRLAPVASALCGPCPKLASPHQSPIDFNHTALLDLPLPFPPGPPAGTTTGRLPPHRPTAVSAGLAPAGRQLSGYPHPSLASAALRRARPGGSNDAAVIQQLQAAREAKGLSLADIYERTGMDRSALSKLENVTNENPTIDTLLRYAEVVGKRLQIQVVDW